MNEEPQQPMPVLRRYMPELDTLRGVAVLLVFLYHGLFWSAPAAQLTPSARAFASLFRFGWSGVQLFFVLSGLLITDHLIASRDRADYYGRFYKRRALRILPALLLLVAGLLAAGAIDWRYALLSVAGFANVAMLFGVALQYPPLWSLAVEQQFYVVWPATVRRMQPRTIALLAAVVFAASPLARAWAHVHAPDGLYFHTWFNLDGIALGALLAIVARGPRERFRRTAFALVASGAILALLGARAGILSREFLAGAALQSTVLYLVYGGVLGLALLAGSARRRVVAERPLRWFGDISYGLYLVHVACFVAFDRLAGSWTTTRGLSFLALRFALAGGVAVVVATLSRRYFEALFLTAGRSSGRPSPADPSSSAENNPAPAPAY